MERTIRKDPWLRRERRRLRAGRTRVLREMDIEVRRLEQDRRLGDRKMARYEERRRMAEEKSFSDEDSTEQSATEGMLPRELLQAGARPSEKSSIGTASASSMGRTEEQKNSSPSMEGTDPLQEQEDSSWEDGVVSPSLQEAGAPPLQAVENILRSGRQLTHPEEHLPPGDAGVSRGSDGEHPPAGSQAMGSHPSWIISMLSREPGGEEFVMPTFTTTTTCTGNNCPVVTTML